MENTEENQKVDCNTNDLGYISTHLYDKTDFFYTDVLGDISTERVTLSA